MKRLVALIYGGRGCEREVSRMGYRCVSGLFDREKYELLGVEIDERGDWYVCEGECRTATYPIRVGGRGGLLLRDRIICPDAAFPLLHGDMGEDGCIQGLLSATGIPYVGEGVRVGAVASDKYLTKLIARAVGIPTVREVCIDGREDPCLSASRVVRELGLPVFVKPTSLGSSVGAREAYTEEELGSAIADARVRGGRVMAEEPVRPKRELECALLVRDGEYFVTPPGEILCADTYGYAEKYGGVTATATVADVSEEVSLGVREYARLLAEALGVEVMGRFDFFLYGERLVFNEVNTMPGMTGESLYLRMLEASGMPPAQVLDVLVSRAEVRR